MVTSRQARWRYSSRLRSRQKRLQCQSRSRRSSTCETLRCTTETICGYDLATQLQAGHASVPCNAATSTDAPNDPHAQLADWLACGGTAAICRVSVKAMCNGDTDAVQRCGRCGD